MTDLDVLNMKIPLILSTLQFMSSLNFIVSLLEHEKSFIILRPGFSMFLLFLNFHMPCLNRFYELCREKTCFLHMRKQRHRSAAQLISSFVFAT